MGYCDEGRVQKMTCSICGGGIVDHRVIEKGHTVVYEVCGSCGANYGMQGTVLTGSPTPGASVVPTKVTIFFSGF